MHAIFCEKRGRRERKERGKKGGGKERKRREKVLVVAVLVHMWLVPVLSVYFYVAMAKGRLRVQLLFVCSMQKSSDAISFPTETPLRGLRGSLCI